MYSYLPATHDVINKVVHFNYTTFVVYIYLDHRQGEYLNLIGY